MSGRVMWVGLQEFKAELRAMPATLTAEGDMITRRAAFGAADSVRIAYAAHRLTGRLEDHVTITDLAHARFGTGYVVRATAHHAHLFEWGTQARHTALGWDRGAARPGNVFVPRMQRARAAMYRELAAMMRGHGLTVTEVVGIAA